MIRDRSDRFYAMDVRCPHEGGPLDEGDIEELAGRLLVICPWHSFDFDASTGESSTGLKQTTYATRVVDGVLYVNTCTQLDLKRPGLKPTNDSSVNNTSATSHKETDKSDSKNLSLCDWAIKILNTSDPNEKVSF